MRSLVGVHALEIRHVTHGRILGQDAVGAEQPAGFPGDVGGDAHVVALGQAHLLRREGARVLHAAEVERQELALDDLGEHVGQAHLLDLEAADRLAEHHARLRVRECFLVAGDGCAHGAPRDAIARLRQAHQRALEAGRARQDRIGGQVHVAQHQFAGDRRAQRQLALGFLGGETAGARGHQESTHAMSVVVTVFGLGPDHGHMRHRAVGDPHLAAVEDPRAVLLLARARDHPGRVRAVVRLGEAETADGLAGGHLRQPVAFLRVAAEREDRVHHQRALHAGERANARVAALEFLVDQSVGHVAQPGAAVLLREVGAEIAERAHLGNELGGKAAVHVALANDRQDLGVHEGAHRVANRPLFLGEGGVDVVKVARAGLEGGRAEERISHGRGIEGMQFR